MVCIRFFGIFFIKISAKIKIYKINSSFLSKFCKILECLKRICKEVFKFLLVLSIFKARRALVLHFVIKNQVIFKFQGILSTIFSDFFQNIQELVGKMNKVKKRNERWEIWTLDPLHRRPLPYPLHYQHIHMWIAVKT